MFASLAATRIVDHASHLGNIVNSLHDQNGIRFVTPADSDVTNPQHPLHYALRKADVIYVNQFDSVSYPQ
jgi:hypothetical protein